MLMCNYIILSLISFPWTIIAVITNKASRVENCYFFLHNLWPAWH